CGCVHLGPRSGLLLAKSDPLRWGLRVSFRSFPDDVAHFPDIGNRDLAPAQPADESEDGGLAGGQIHGRANLRRQDAAEMRRPERKVAVDHPTAEKRPSVLASSSAANGRNQRTRTKPTFLPSRRICRMATFTGVESVPMPT